MDTDTFRERVKAVRGGLTRLASELGINPGAISQWVRIPPEHVLKIEQVTGMSRHDLRPDIYGPAPELTDDERERAEERDRQESAA